MADVLKDRLRADLNEVRRAKDRFRTTVLTTMLAEVRNHEIQQRREAVDADVVTVLARAIKQRQEAAEMMREGGRAELAEKEEREVELLRAYMPAAMSDDDIRSLVRKAIEAGAENIGAVMGSIMPELKGRFDGREANRIAREELEAAGNG